MSGQAGGVVMTQSERVREIIREKYVRPAMLLGQERLSIRARDVLKDAEATEAFPRGRTPTVCNVLRSRKLLHEMGLEIESIEGPASQQSRRVVVHYLLSQKVGRGPSERPAESTESSQQRAERLTGQLFGLLRDELTEYGGADGFIRWMRQDEKPGA